MGCGEGRGRTAAYRTQLPLAVSDDDGHVGELGGATAGRGWAHRNARSIGTEGVRAVNGLRAAPSMSWNALPVSFPVSSARKTRPH